MLPSDERDVVSRARHGDREAFGEIVRRHQQDLFSIACRMLGDAREAEDAAQEVFLRAYRSLDTFQSARPLRPWLRRIMVNLCLNRLASRRPVLELDEELAETTELDPERQTLTKDLRERLARELDCLPARYRAVLVLRHYEDMSYEEIARAIGRPVSDVKSDLFRARKLLSGRLSDLR